MARVPPAKAAQSSIQNPWRSRNSSRSASDTGASRIGQEPAPCSESRRRLVRRALAIGRPERQHLPPRLARRREPVDELKRGCAKLPARKRGRCSCIPLVRGSRMWERGVFVPARAKAKPPSRIRIAYPSPTVDCGRWPVKRTVADTVQVSADIFRDGHEVLRAVVRWRDARGQALARGAADPGRRPSQRRALGGRLHRREARAHAVEHPGVGRPLRRLARRAGAQGRVRPARPQRRAQRGRRAPARHGRPRQGRGQARA